VDGFAAVGFRTLFRRILAQSYPYNEENVIRQHSINILWPACINEITLPQGALKSVSNIPCFSYKMKKIRGAGRIPDKI
jgi:hypothetical protein